MGPFASGVERDCDLNGLPDSCDIAAGASDLAALLTAWGTADPNADFNGDGNVSAADIALLLQRWGL